MKAEDAVCLWHVLNLLQLAVKNWKFNNSPLSTALLECVYKKEDDLKTIIKNYTRPHHKKIDTK